MGSYPRAMKAAAALVEKALSGGEYRDQLVELIADTYAQLSEKNPTLKRQGHLHVNTTTCVERLEAFVTAWPWDDEAVALVHEALTDPVTGAVPVLRACLETSTIPKARIADLGRLRTQIDKLRAEVLRDAGDDDEDQPPEQIRAEALRLLLEESTPHELEDAARAIDQRRAELRRAAEGSAQEPT